MNKKIKNRTGINLVYFVIFLFIIYVIHFTLMSVLESSLMIKIFNTLLIILLYFALANLINCLFLYEDKMEIVYFFRLFNRRIRLEYDEIISVKCIHKAHKNSTPRIQLYIKNRSIKFEFPSNSFPIRSFKKRSEIIKMFHSRGIEIKINSDFEKDYSILENSNLR